MSQYSVRDMLRIHGDGITRPGTPVRTQDAAPTPTPPPKPKPAPVVREKPHTAFGEELGDTVLRKIHAIGEYWGKRPYVPENFHKALEDVLDVLGGKDGLPALAASPVDEKEVECDVYRDGKLQKLVVTYKATFEFAGSRSRYRKLHSEAANLQVKEDE